MAGWPQRFRRQCKEDVCDVRDLITEWNSCIYQGRYFEMFAVESGSRIVGYVSLYEKSRSVASAGVEIFPEERGKGFASVAMIDLLKYAAEKVIK